LSKTRGQNGLVKINRKTISNTTERETEKDNVPRPNSARENEKISAQRLDTSTAESAESLDVTEVAPDLIGALCRLQTYFESSTQPQETSN